jgi:succinylglutamate desuccinylase
MALLTKALSQELEAFLSRSSPGPFSYRACHFVPGHDSRSHLVLGFATHGNEHGTLPAMLELWRTLKPNTLPVDVTLLLGNLDALLKDERFLEEDLNRVFTFDRPASSLERKRAELMRPILDQADVFIDFHQTQTPTERPFYTFPWDPNLADWARWLGMAEVALTRKSGQAFSPGLCCLDEYVRARGKVGLTIETGYRGADPKQVALVLQGVERALVAAAEVARDEARIEALARTAPALSWYTTTHILQTQGPESRLRPGLQNWTPIGAGELLSEPGVPPIVAPAAGMTLFPKYVPPGQTPPPELVRIASPLADPSSLSG